MKTKKKTKDRQYLGMRIPKEAHDYVVALGLKNASHGVLQAIIGHATHLAPSGLEDLAVKAIESCQRSMTARPGRPKEKA